MARAWRRTAVAVAAGAIAAIGPFAGQAQQDAATRAAPLPAVTVAEASTRGLAQTARFSGRLVADKRVAVMARVSGMLLDVGFSAGDIVEEGQLLFRIDPELFEASRREAEGALRAAQAQRDLAEIERDRQRELVARNAAPQANLDNAEATLGRAEGDLIRAEAALQSAGINLSYTEITAPFEGRIGPTQVDPGALIGNGSEALATLIDLDPIHADFQVPTAVLRNFIEAVEAGTASEEAAVYLELANGTVFEDAGDVDFVDSEVNAGTDSVRVRALFDNPDGVLLDGELVRVELRASSVEDTLAVPQEAVQRDVQGAFVLVVDDAGTVAARRVVAARSAEGFTVIAQGLEPGERVVIEGANKVRPGQQVDAVLAEDG